MPSALLCEDNCNPDRFIITRRLVIFSLELSSGLIQSFT
jgi:hypothetical protein